MEQKSYRKRSHHYINNDEFYEAICKWKSSGEEGVSEELLVFFVKLVKRELNKPKYLNFKRFRDDAESAAILRCISKAKKFNEVKYNNPYMYFYMTARNALFAIFNDFKKLDNFRKSELEIEDPSLTTNDWTGISTSNRDENDEYYDPYEEIK